jgi:hypothetical protein
MRLRLRSRSSRKISGLPVDRSGLGTSLRDMVLDGIGVLLASGELQKLRSDSAPDAKILVRGLCGDGKFSRLPCCAITTIVKI